MLKIWSRKKQTTKNIEFLRNKGIVLRLFGYADTRKKREEVLK